MSLKLAGGIRRESAYYIGARSTGCNKAGYRSATYRQCQNYESLANGMRSYSRVMNYSGHEKLRAEVAALANSMCDLRATLKVLEERYHWQRHGLTERLAGQSLRRINTLLDEAYNESLMLNECFKD